MSEHDEGNPALDTVRKVGATTGGVLDFAEHMTGHHLGGKYFSPFEIWNGATELDEAIEGPSDPGAGGAGVADRVLKGSTGAMDIASGAIGLTELAGPELATLGPIGAVLGAFSTGVSIGHFLDETFGLSDKLSGPTPTERSGYVNMKRGDIAGANRDYFAQSRHRLHAAEGDEGVMPMLEARQQLSEDVADPKIMAAAKAQVAMDHEVERQKEQSERIQALVRAKREGGLVGQMAQVELARLAEPYSD